LGFRRYLGELPKDLHVSEAGGCMVAELSKSEILSPEHGAYEVGPENGALFILGCMDESKALPILLSCL